MYLEKEYDVIVIGAGHAGIEAALASARMGAKTGLFTINLDHVAQMSCNPAIGGLAKGQLVREIDALGGEMAKAIDKTGIQFKVLNSKKGPAVRGLRAQADKKQYHLYMKYVLENQENLDLRQAMVEKIITSDNKVEGILTDTDAFFKAKAIIITTGTFLKGEIFIGLKRFPAGRAGDPPSNSLSDSLKELGLKLGRLKTGTPPRVNRKSLDFSKFIEQPGDKIPTPFSFSTEKIEVEQVMCYLVNTNKLTHSIISDNLDRSPLYSPTNRMIFGIGPRYCPSIEDKVVKFSDKESHQIFLEPEGRYTNEIYLNGLATSLPRDVQLKFLKTLPGFENVEIMRPGYAIEYDFVPPTQITHSLEVKTIPNLFLAGQINGTSGYEEAAAQGIVAGINAALKIRGEKPFILDRTQAYIGVLIDDLVTKGVTEPYRLFSSRAEHRLLLRNDNADIRLMDYGRKFGLIDDKMYDKFMRKKEFFTSEIKRLKSIIVKPTNKVNENLKKLNSSPLKEPLSLFDIFKRPEINYNDLELFTEIKKNIPEHFIDYLDAEVKYHGYIKQQEEKIKKLKKLENKKIPDDFDYYKFDGLSIEAKQKLSEVKPKTIGQASRIPGVSPSDINVLLILLKKYNV